MYSVMIFLVIFLIERSADSLESVYYSFI